MTREVAPAGQAHPRAGWPPPLHPPSRGWLSSERRLRARARPGAARRSRGGARLLPVPDGLFPRPPCAAGRAGPPGAPAASPPPQTPKPPNPRSRTRAELHHERGVGGRGDAAGGEVDDGQLARPCHLSPARTARPAPSPPPSARPRACAVAPDVIPQRAHVAHGLDDVAGAGLALRADHRRALADAPQRLAQVAAAAHERHLEACLLMWCASSAGVSTSDSSM